MSEKKLLIFFIYVGIALRLMWPQHIEWKADEIYVFEYALAWLKGEKAFPWIGMTSGAGLPNPPLGFWILMWFSSFAKNPVGATQLVTLLNALTIWGGMYFWRHDRQKLWALAFFSVSFFPILFAKKLWIQCLLPPFVLSLEILNSSHRKAWAVLSVGFFLALLGQIHMSGFFYALVWLIWNYKRYLNSWILFGVGVLVGSVPMVPWFFEIFNFKSGGGSLFREFMNPAPFLKMWSYVFSVEVFYSLGQHTFSFLKQPHVALFFVSLIGFLGFHVVHVFKKREFVDPFERIFVWIFVPLFMFLGVSFPMHYLIVFFVWPFYWLVLRFDKYYKRPTHWKWIYLLVNLVFTILFWSWVRMQAPEIMKETPMGILYGQQKT